MLSRITEGNKFESPFSETVFEVRKVHTNTVLLEDVIDKNHQFITEMATLGNIYQKIDGNVLRQGGGRKV